MSEWGWIAFGYSVVYGALTLYIGWTMMRMHRARQTLRDLQ